MKTRTFENKPAWLAAKGKLLGGSEAAAAIGRSKWTSRHELWEIKTGRRKKPDISGKPSVQFGILAEKPLRDLFAVRFRDVYRVSYGGAFDMCVHDRHPWMVATLDGRLHRRDTDEPGILEVKTTTAHSLAEFRAWLEGPPETYVWQVRHQMNVTGWNYGIITAGIVLGYLEGEPMEVRDYAIFRDDNADEMAWLEAGEVDFWQNFVTADREPPFDFPRI